MATRDDSDLYTGVVFQDAFDNVPVDKDELREQEELSDENRKLLPSVELVITVIDEEIATMSDIRSYFANTKKSGDELKNEYEARELYFDFLNRLKGGIEARVNEVKDGDNA